MLGIHLLEVKRTFLGQDDPNVMAVQQKLAQLLARTNSIVQERQGAASPPKRTEFKVGDIQYRISFEERNASQQGEMDVAVPRVTAMLGNTVSKVYPLYPSDFKSWSSYGGGEWRINQF